MSLSLRARTLRCFYCGSRSAKKQDGVIRQFKCESCEAVNFLDKNGNITDPPIESVVKSSELAPTSLRYARPTSPPPPSQTASAIFCSTCLKNQHLYRENIAAYLPPENAPEYSRFLASLPAYEAKLEQRYPQVCADCAPAARERIKRAGYVAKTDHLRRMIDSSKDGHLLRQRSGWRRAILNTAGLCYYGSASYQFIWHSACIYNAAYLRSQSSGPDESDQTLKMDLQIASTLTSLAHMSSNNLAQWMPFAIYMGIVTLWWNDKLSKRYLISGGRLKGLVECLILNVIGLAMRYAAFYLLTIGNTTLATSQTVQGIHLFMALFIPLLTLLASASVQIDTKPSVTFHSPDDDILPGLPTEPSRATSSISSPSSTDSVLQESSGYPLSVASRHGRPFPINALISSPSAASAPPLAHRIPTPPPDDEPHDPDAMDWTPTHPITSPKPQLQPRSRFQTPMHNVKSPFYGSLPPPPGSMQHPRQSASSAVVRSTGFQKAPQEKTATLFASLAKRGDKAKLEGDIDGKLGETPIERPGNDGRQRRPSHGFTMNPASFFAPQDLEKMETGLESMFDEVFQLKDEPGEVMNREAEQSCVGVAPSELNPEQRGQGLFDVPSVRAGTDVKRRGRKTAVMLSVMLPVAILGGVAVLIKRPAGLYGYEGLRATNPTP